MEIYKVGKIVAIGKTYIILENNWTGTIIYVSRPRDFEKETTRKVFVYNYTNEYVSQVYGFLTFKERQLFEMLISVNGIGPKTAIALLKDGPQKIIDAIGTSDANTLMAYPSLGPKTAKQLIFELQGRLSDKVENESTGQLLDALKTLGFNKEQIKYALKNIEITSSIEDDIEQAIKLISNAQRTQTQKL